MISKEKLLTIDMETLKAIVKAKYNLDTVYAFMDEETPDETMAVSMKGPNDVEIMFTFRTAALDNDKVYWVETVERLVSMQYIKALEERIVSLTK